MLQVTIPGIELFDDEKGEFIVTKSESLQLAHSLVSLSKWESKWCKPFLSKDSKTTQETVDYIRCMTISQNVKPSVYQHIPDSIFKQIADYVNAPMTATWFADQAGGTKNRDVITAEIIYYWMITYQIPMECQKWHLNRLLTLIRVCSVKNAPPKKMGKREMFSHRRALNEARRNQFNTKG